MLYVTIGGPRIMMLLQVKAVNHSVCLLKTLHRVPTYIFKITEKNYHRLVDTKFRFPVVKINDGVELNSEFAIFNLKQKYVLSTCPSYT